MTPELLAVHVAGALPLAALLALAWRPKPAVAVVAGLAAAGLLAAGWDVAGDLFAVTDAGFAVRSLTRSAACVLGLLPWAAVAVPLLRLPAGPTRLGLGAAAAAAVVVPLVAADRFAATAINDARSALARSRPLAAQAALATAVELAPHRTLPLDGKPVRLSVVATELGAEVIRLTRAADRPLPADAPPQARFDRAGVLLALDRPAEAETLLRPLADGSPRARLRLAEAVGDQGRWAEAGDQCRAAINALRAAAATDQLRQAFDALADTHARRGDRAGVEAVLREAADAVPAAAGHFRLRLGEHYRTTGRPFAALDELREAVRLDPSLAARASAVEWAVRDQTPGCLAGR